MIKSLATNNIMKCNPDILADVKYFSAEHFTNKEYLSTEYAIRHDHLVKEDYLTCGVHDYFEENKIYANRIYKTNIKFISPEVYPKSLWVGKNIQIQRGSKIIGEAIVIKIFNKTLQKK